MINMLRDLPAFKAARVNLLHVVTEQSKNESEEHWSEAGNLLSTSIQKLGLNPEEVNSIIRHGDAKQTVLKVADELNVDLIVMGSRGLGRLQSILSNSASHLTPNEALERQWCMSVRPCPRFPQNYAHGTVRFAGSRSPAYLTVFPWQRMGKILRRLQNLVVGVIPRLVASSAPGWQKVS